MQGIHSQCRRRSVLLLCQWWAFLKFLNHQVPQTSILFNLFNFAFSAQWLRGSTQSLPWSCALPFLHPSPFASSLHSTQGMEVYCKSSSRDFLMAWSFSRLAEMKGATATDYGLIIGTNCLVAFIVTPFIGNHLDSIGVKFAFVTGILGGGACCLLSGFLEFFEPGSTFITMSVLIRLDGSGLTFWLESMIWVGCQCQVGRIGYFELAFVGDLTKILRILHAISNAMTITSTFTYTACEFPTAVAKIFSITRCPDYWLFLSWTVENY